MFCPHCGQQQSSNEIRYCSRCGFPLANVAQLLANNGVLAGLANESTKLVSPRRRGVRQGVTLIFIGFILTPLLAIIDFPETVVALSALIFMFGGLLRIIYAALLEAGAPPASAVELPAYAPPVISPPLAVRSKVSEQHVLPPPQSVPISPVYPPQRVNTAEIVAPPSVTEHTTRLLKDQPDAERQS